MNNLANDTLQLQKASTWIWLALWLVYTFVISALFLKFPVSPDDAVYDYIGWVVLNGGSIYVDAADQNWPGMVVPHVLSTWLFGNTGDAYRKFDLIWLFVDCGVLAMFARRAGMRLWTSLLVIPLYQGIYVCQSYWMVGQRDIHAAILLLIASDAHLRRLEGKGRGWSVLQGVMIALATLVRPTMLGMAGFLGLANLWTRLRNKEGVSSFALDQLAAFAGLCLTFGACALIGLPSGALQAFWEIAVLYNLRVYSTHGPSLWEMLKGVLEIVAYWFWAVAIAVVGYRTAWRNHLQAVATLGAMVATTLVSFIVQGKGFGYHLGPLFPVLALMMAPGVDWAISRVSFRPVAGVPSFQRYAAIGICLVCVAGFGRKISKSLRTQIDYYRGKVSARQILEPENPGLYGMSLADALDMANFVKATTAPGTYFLLWGRPMHVNFMAERRSPSHVASFAMFAEPRADFPLFEAWKERFERDLAEKPPALVCAGRGVPDSNDLEELLPPGPEEHLSDVLYRDLQANYGEKPERIFGKVECYRRRGSAAPLSAGSDPTP